MHTYNRIRRRLSQNRLDDAPASSNRSGRSRLKYIIGSLVTIAGYVAGIVSVGCNCMQPDGRDTMCEGPHDFIPAPNVAQLEMVYNLDEQIIENRFFLEGAEQWTLASLTELATTALDEWQSSIAPLISDQVHLILARATDMEVDDGAGVEIEPGSDIAGEVTGGSLPSNVTLTTKFGSGLTGRSHRGRVYTPGIPRTSVGTTTVNEVTPVVAGSFSSGWANFFSGLIANVENCDHHVIVSYCFNKAWRTTADITTVINYSTEVTLDSQRRRLPGRGQ